MSGVYISLINPSTIFDEIQCNFTFGYYKIKYEDTVNIAAARIQNVKDNISNEWKLTIVKRIKTNHPLKCLTHTDSNFYWTILLIYAKVYQFQPKRFFAL